MKVSDIENFLESRPAISKSAFCREAGISKRYLDYIVEGERPLTDDTADKLLTVMKKYGCSKNK